MAPKALDILKKGLDIFSDKIKERKEKLNAKLSQNKTISSAGEQQQSKHSRKQMEMYELLQHHVGTCYWGSEYENLPKEPKEKLAQAAAAPVFTRKEM